MSATRPRSFLADLRKQRDDFRAHMKTQSEANEAALDPGKSKTRG